MIKLSRSYLISRSVIVFSCLMALGLAVAVWNINPWPTDAEAYYMPAAFKVPHVRYLSEIHPSFDMEKVRWLHGKELYIVGITVFQFLLNDFDTLRPLMLLGIVSIALASILLFYLARYLWDERVALVCYLLFVFCMWPYVYILFAKHQTLGLLYFLAAILFLLPFKYVKKSGFDLRYFWPVISGFFMGLSSFASTVSSLYMPFYALALGYVVTKAKSETTALERLKIFLGISLLALAGFCVVFLYVNLPDVLYNITSFQKYIKISGAFNHFYYNQTHLQQWFPHQNVGEIRGGWLWVFRYLFVIMPVLFPLYIFASVYLLVVKVYFEKSRYEKILNGVLLGVSFLPLVMAEAVQVAQYGSNYFPFLMGVLFVIGLALHDLKRQFFSPVIFARVKMVVGLVILLHIGINAYTFLTDIYPTRMVTTFISDKIRKLNIKQLWTYKANKHRNNFVYCLSPDLRDRLGWLPLQYIIQAPQGYILLPPLTGSSIYIAATTTYGNFDKDVFLVQMVRKGLLKSCAVASFPTLANSRIWRHEEEILSYRDLILGHRFPEDELGRAWLLDAALVQKHKAELNPPRTDFPLIKGEIQNIGTQEKFFLFDSQRIFVKADQSVAEIVTHIWKMGEPTDGLILSIFKNEDIQPIWIPLGKHFTSLPLNAKYIPADSRQGAAAFQFDPPLKLKRGVYQCVIYRTGQPDDHHYYQIDPQHFGIP